MHEEEIKFSILVPVYNVERYVDDCIQSVLKQTYSNYELILVDDGSTDRSGSICDNYAKKYNQISVLHSQNQGPLLARKTAIENATGRYYVFLDSDDLLEANALQIINNTIKRHYCDCVFYNRKQLINGNLIKPTYSITEGYTTDKRIILRHALIESPYNALVLKCARAEMFSGFDYSSCFHIKMGEDLLQSLEVLENCKTAEFINESIYIYRFREGSAVTSKDSTKYNVDYTVRSIALKVVNEIAVFTKDDYNEYRDKCIGIFIDQIIEIAKLKMNKALIIEYYFQIRESDYYNDFLRKGITDKKRIGKKSIIYDLFLERRYNLILLLVKLATKAALLK